MRAPAQDEVDEGVVTAIINRMPGKREQQTTCESATERVLVRQAEIQRRIDISNTWHWGLEKGQNHVWESKQNQKDRPTPNLQRVQHQRPVAQNQLGLLPGIYQGFLGSRMRAGFDQVSVTC